MSFFTNHHPMGIVLCIGLGFLGIQLASVSPIDAVTLSIVLGALVGNIARVPTEWKSGIVWSEKKMLGVAIALYGLKLDFALLQELGWISCLMILVTMSSTLLLAKPLAKLFGLDGTMGLTIGIGTAVCGSAAIGATKDIIEADEAQAGMGIAVINFIGTLGIFLLPLLGVELLGLGTVDNGFMLGNSLQAVGQVVAASFAVDEATGQVATVVKMGRVLMLTPLIFILLQLFQSKKQKDESQSVSIPRFVLGFLFFSVLASLQVLPADIVKGLGGIGKTLLIISMAGIGLKISIAKIKEYGLSALGLALLLFSIQLGLSVLMVLV